MSQKPFTEKKNLLVSMAGSKESAGGYSTLTTTTMPLDLPLASLNSRNIETTLLRSQRLNTTNSATRKAEFRNIQDDIDDEGMFEKKSPRRKLWFIFIQYFLN
jgi:hypothetical protein